MTDIAMPRLSDSMEEGTILKWLKAEGEEIARGDELVEVETDKATMTYEADAGGFLRLVAREGDTLAVGAIIARLLGSPDEAIPTDGPTPDTSAGLPPAPAAVDPPPPVHEPRGASAALSRVKASPLARRLAADRGLDLATLRGTGPGGRVVRADVDRASGAAAPEPLAAPAPPVAPAPAEAGGVKGTVEVTELTRTQAVIARRMAESKATVPEFTVAIDVDAEPAFALREQLRGVASPLPSVNDIVIKACAAALRQHPRVNASYRDGRFETYSRVNVGMAVAAEGTLVVPTVFDADAKSLAEVAGATRALATKVREGTVTPPELSGGTFTVSNLGMFGVSRFIAVINTPQAAILAVGAAVPRAVPAADGTIAVRRVMELTLTADHRILYGADAAAFLATLRDLLEQPLRMLV
jgi:pyruvate dehydrogenase E2 component (dihydrolipoamide acetyltransferase)